MDGPKDTSGRDTSPALVQNSGKLTPKGLGDPHWRRCGAAGDCRQATETPWFRSISDDAEEFGWLERIEEPVEWPAVAKQGLILVEVLPEIETE